jgi:hypothetical protein
MREEPESCAAQAVNFRRVDLYEYFARTRPFDSNVIEGMFANRGFGTRKLYKCSNACSGFDVLSLRRV